MVVHNVLLDLDGTLTDPSEGVTGCIAYALKRMDRPVPPLVELQACIGPPLLQTFTRLLGSSDPEHANRGLSLYRERFGTIGKYENVVYPGIPEALANLLESGCRLFLATSKPIYYAADIVRYFDLDQYFTGLYGAEMTGERTDKAELIAHVIAQESLPAARCRMVGDRRHDVEGAHANGVLCVGALWGYGGREELTAAGADWLCECPDELPTKLLGR